MDRRSFFVSLGAIAVTPLAGTQLVACHRDARIPGGDPRETLFALRAFVMPEGVPAALPFQPLRRRPRP